MNHNLQDPSPIIQISCRVTARFIQLFALYVIFHGHYGPGGGFQGGALLASAIILIRFGDGFIPSQREFASHLALPLGALGVLIFAATGLASFLAYASGNPADPNFSAQFLDYAAIPIDLPSDQLHYWGMLIIEIGVAIAVMSILTGIFDLLFYNKALTKLEEGDTK